MSMLAMSRSCELSTRVVSWAHALYGCTHLWEYQPGHLQRAFVTKPHVLRFKELRVWGLQEFQGGNNARAAQGHTAGCHVPVEWRAQTAETRG